MKSIHLLAALAASMGGIDPFMPRLPSPRKRYVPQPVDHRAECLKVHGKRMRHRVTGDSRKVCVYFDAVVFVDCVTSRAFTRPHRKALDWIRNADVVGGES